MRRAFRRLARQTHPDRGGSAQAFHPIRVAYDALAADLDGERRRWQSAPVAPGRASRAAAGLDPRTYPTCTVRIGRSRDGVRQLAYLTERRPEGWRPGTTPPPGGTCVAQVAAAGSAPAFGVWTVPLDGRRFRCVFGPSPAGG